MNFLTKEQVEEIEKSYSLPVYVYSEAKLLEAAQNFLDFPDAF
jgi:diaminopimelate decarboxylase